MTQTTIELPAETYEALKRMAAERGSSVDSLAQLAVEEFVSLSHMSEAEYQRRWDELLHRVRSRLPEGITEEEIEREIDAATDEVWGERRRARRS